MTWQMLDSPVNTDTMIARVEFLSHQYFSLGGFRYQLFALLGYARLASRAPAVIHRPRRRRWTGPVAAAASSADAETACARAEIRNLA